MVGMTGCGRRDDRLGNGRRWMERVQAVLPDGVAVVTFHDIHNGWDDGVMIACGKSHGDVIVWAHGLGEMPDIEAQAISLSRHLLAKEALRLEYERAVDDSFARFYRGAT